MSKGLSIVVALGLAVFGLFFAAGALVALVYSFASELPPDERLPTLMVGVFFGFLAAGCLGGGALLIVRALRRPPSS